jgi:WXG100 family type VII secretion target
MPAAIVVQPGRLRQAALRARALRGRLLEVRGQVGPTVAGVEPALGDGRARQAFEELWTRWSASAERLAASVADLAAALEAAADAYERADGETGAPGGGGANAAAW